MDILKLKKINDIEIDSFIDNCYEIQEYINSLTKDNILESKDLVLSKLDKLANLIDSSQTKFENEKKEILNQLNELSSFYTSKFLIVGFD